MVGIALRDVDTQIGKRLGMLLPRSRCYPITMLQEFPRDRTADMAGRAEDKHASPGTRRALRRT